MEQLTAFLVIVAVAWIVHRISAYWDTRRAIRDELDAIAREAEKESERTKQ